VGLSAAVAAVGVAEEEQVSLRVASPIFIVAPDGKRIPRGHATSATPCNSKERASVKHGLIPPSPPQPILFIWPIRSVSCFWLNEVNQTDQAA
jgi:hypothetical protein